MNNLTIAGALGRDAETRTTQTGETVTGFSVAVSNGKDRDATWFDCSLWGDRGPKRVIREIVDSLDRDSVLREARDEILARLKGQSAS